MASRPPRHDSPKACPVDSSAREEWLKDPHESSELRSQHAPDGANPLSGRLCSQATASPVGGGSWLSYLAFWQKDDFPIISPALPLPQSQSSARSKQRIQQPANSLLGTDRIISSIPRTNEPAQPSAGCPADRHIPTVPSSSSQLSPNAETEAPQTSLSGNWVYPSESQFFSALNRKGHAANRTDMSVIVPIHNAVNERAWSQILEWETPYPAPCGTPKLHSFSGDSKKLTPKARIMSLLGYQRPFDRHDWTIDRCGMRVDYVIDFYGGKGKEGKISFYLDVRPKLNSWEGVKMRILRGLGVV